MFYKVTIPESTNLDEPLFQNGTEDLELAVDTFLENGTWESFDPDTLSGEPILRVRNLQISARVLCMTMYSII
ncbi:hypothetical protein L798_04454 [Zootermopsis nevadensis]|uniref:Uncharacterized protein n=1 Tax=Zootermopsis nevadensis TaxID=136037 RepID=A0A067QSS2_ZOONE|nr:hypothetical protein L798_04454 [Zootermopsis nevadensis]